MIYSLFGLPGSGKSSLVCWIAFELLRRMDDGKCRYKRIYTNCPLNIPDDRVFVLPYSKMRCHDLFAGSLLIIDEASMEFSDRSHKDFGKQDTLLFTQHRRFGYDIIVLCQKAGGIDKNVRTLCERVYMVRKGKLLPAFSHIYPVGYGVYIPRKKDEGSVHYGEIMEGYFRWTWVDRLFHTRFYRPPVYGFYDSFCRPPYPGLAADELEFALSVDIPEEPFAITIRSKLLRIWMVVRSRFEKKFRKSSR